MGKMMIAIATEIGKLPNKISLEGHTDAAISRDRGQMNRAEH